MVPRFTLTERLSHWSFASFFLIAFLTGLLMWLPPTREWLGGDRLRVSHLHGGLGYLMVLTPLLLLGLFDRRHLVAGVREVDRWDADDRRWFWMAVRGGTLRGVAMPPQRRLNAGQKFNVVLVAAIVVGFVVTGSILLFRADVPAWLVSRALWLHGFLAILGIGIFLGHLAHVFLTSHGRHYLHAMVRGELSLETATSRHSKWEARPAPEAQEQGGGTSVAGRSSDV